MKKFLLCFIVCVSSAFGCNCNLHEEFLSEIESYEIYDDFCVKVAQQDIEGARVLYEKLREQYKNFPRVIEHDDGHLELSNLDSKVLNEAFRKEFSKRMVEFGVCDSEDDVSIKKGKLHIWPKSCKKKVQM